MGRFALRWLDRNDEKALARARAFVDERFLDRVPVHASLEQPGVAERSRLLEVLRGDHLFGLAAVVEGVFAYRSVPIAALLPGAAAAAISAIERPFTAYAGEPIWSEVERAGGRPLLEEMQMARLERAPLGAAEARVERLEDWDELVRFHGPNFSRVHFEAGPFVGIRGADGAILSAGGVQLRTGRVAQLGYLGTVSEQRRRGLARAVLTELIRLLETPARRLVLHVRADNHAAIQLYAALGFRGRRRVRLYAFEAERANPS